MNVRRTLMNSILATAVAAAVVWGCVGGGISGTSIVLGPILGFGSVIVGDIRFSTATATITVEGDPAREADLRLGMVVVVRGSVNRAAGTGIATRIAADHVMLAKVEGVNAAQGTFAAMSQLVITDSSTVFDGTTMATLAAGDDVEVFGFYDADGSVRATRVELRTDVEEYELTGTISAFDPIDETFMLGALLVDFSGAVIEDAPPTGLADGLLVEAESDTPPTAGVLAAVSVEVEDPSGLGDEGDGLEIQGFVTRVVSADEFVVNGTQRVMLTPDTRFENGTAADIVRNAEVEVEGQFESGGLLRASEVEFR